MRIRIIVHCIISVLVLVIAGIVDHARAEEPPKKVPVTVKADKLDYDRTNDIYRAEGHVKVEQEGMYVEADRIIVNNKTGEATAEGKVFMQEKEDTIRADKLMININTKAGLMYNGDLFMSKDNLHLKGETIERKSETVYHIEKGTFTTCDAGEWYLKADEIDVDMNRYATGRGVSFNMIGLPMFYTPYLLFPVRRQSGLLIPEVGYSSSDGFLLKNAVFWAISDFQDATLYSDYRARRGHGTGVEYRYMGSLDSWGKIFFNYFDTFPRYRIIDVPDARWLLSYQHHEEIAEDLSVRADINLVSDFAYFRDLEKKLELRSLPYLDSNVFYVERWDTASLNLLGQYGLDLTQKSNDKSVQKLPEIRYNIYEENLFGPLHVNLDASATHFSRQQGENIMRADFNPRLSAAFGRSGISLTPRIGTRATFYDRGESTSDPVDRKYSYAAVDFNARISRVYGSDLEAGIGKIRHSIEPTVSYNYIPRFDQADIPQLDAVDAVVRQNVVSVSLINRLTAHYREGTKVSTFDMMVFRVSESYDMNKARSADTAVNELARSEIRGELFIRTPKLLNISATEVYDTYSHALTSSSESAVVTMEIFRFNISHQYLRQPTETRYVIGGSGVKLGKWDINAQLWRDMVQEKTTQQQYTLYYASQCWGLGLTFIKKPGETQYMLTLDLKGLGALKF